MRSPATVVCLLRVRHLLPACFLALFATAAAAEPARPYVWQRWEHALVSAADYANPYADVTVRVTYAGPDGSTFQTFGFWDGGRTFRVRAAFPVAGTWRWETDCSDSANAGLHAQRGSVEVGPYRGDNPLFERGFLKVGEDRRYLTYGDGTPFLWIGDTAWAAGHRATDAEWETYLADRVAKKFSLIQIAAAPGWSRVARTSDVPPFTDNTCAQWNPAYWQAFDRKVQRANEHGLVIFVVGLMEPVKRYPATGQACLFARNLVARLHGNFVIFSPSFDSRPTPLGHEVGRATRSATSRHLITQHPGTSSGTKLPDFSLYYADESYVDFIGVQSGHNGGNRTRSVRQTIDWMLHLYRHEPPKPVINVEAMYDAQGEKAWQAIDARGLGWRSWLSGAKGYTYGAGDVPPKVPRGAGGIWSWVSDPERYDHWEKALQWESAFQMTHLRDFLAGIRWWELVPAPELVVNPPDDVTRRGVVARLPDRNFAVAYLPDEAGLEVNLAAFTRPLAARWFDPQTGRTTPVARTFAPGGTEHFIPPAPGDWVLVLEPAAATQPKD